MLITDTCIWCFDFGLNILLNIFWNDIIFIFTFTFIFSSNFAILYKVFVIRMSSNILQYQHAAVQVGTNLTVPLSV